MNKISKDLYKKIANITDKIDDDFRRRGIAIPYENDDGTISFGNYKITKDVDGFFSILDYKNFPVVEKINLPHSAMLIANGLALGKFLDSNLINKDKMYGYALFEEQVETRLLNKKSNSSNRDLRFIKAEIARKKKEFFRKDIENTFEKLRKLV